ncbi:MAG: cellulose binding domain-containing protein [Thermobispora bispora]|nr:cellulose binding domain-containing protein [Thermobispora bispora]
MSFQVTPALKIGRRSSRRSSHRVRWRGTAIPAGGTASLGFIAGQSGTDGKPASFIFNGTPCAVR